MRSRRLAALLFVTLAVISFGIYLHGAVPDVPTGQWLPGPALAQPRQGAVSVALDDGRVLVIGGRTAAGPVNTVEVLNTNGSMSAGPQLLMRRVGHTATKLPDGNVLVVGGTTIVTSDDGTGPVAAEAVTNSAEVFDVNAGVWYPAASLSIPRSGHTATVVADGHVVVAGGAGQDAVALDSYEVFDPETGVFSSPGLLSAARIEHAAAAAGATKVLVAGGRNANGVLGTADIVDVASGTVTSIVLNAPRVGASATTLLDGKILVAGGSNGADDLASAELVDPASGVSAATGSMSQPRRDHQALLLDHNNTVLVAGGKNAGAALSGAEQFIPWIGEFSATGSPSATRASAVVSNLSKEGIAWRSAWETADGATAAGSELYGFATVKTDRNDYSPGMTVVMTGSGWQPGERVNLVLHEVGTGHPDQTFYADADASGHIVNSGFLVDTQHIGVRFFLTARGAGSQAQITFTDGNLQSILTFNIGPSTVNGSDVLTWNMTASCDNGGGGGNTCAANGFTLGGPVADGYSFNVEQSSAANFNSPTTRQSSSTTSGAAGGSFTAPAAPGTYFYRVRHINQSIGPNSWQPQNSAVITITVSSCTAPTVTLQPSSQAIAYGQNAVFTAAASGSPAPTVQWQVSTNSGSSWSNLAGQTTTTLSLVKPTVSTSGNQYRAVFTNTCTPATATSNAATLSVSPKNLTISGAVAQNRVYDATAAATVSFSSAVLAGVESGDTVTINSTGYAATFANKTVGNSKPVTVTGVTLSGAAAGNYTVSQPSGLTANITPKGLTIAGALASSRQYDGTAVATVSFAGASLVGVVNGDSVGINTAGYGASFADKTVGTAKPVVVTGVALNGVDAPNYTVSQPSGLTATITPKNLTITAAVASNKPYDGTATATVNFGGSSLVGLVTGDIVTINSAGYAASFADKTVGSNKPVTVTGVLLSGGDAANYTASQPSGLTANITAKALTIAGAVANSRQYDGTVTATVNFSGASLVGAASGDSVSIDQAGYAASFADKTVGTSKPVTVTGVVLSGSDAGNYTVSQPGGLASDITAKSLTGAFTAANKVYDGATAATVATSSLPGVIAPDVVTLNVTNAAFDTKAVGTGKTVTANLALAGVDAGNYTVNVTATALADITPVGITGSFTAADKVYDATTAATIGARTLSGVLGTDVVNLTGGTASFASKNVGTHTVTGTGFTLAGADAGNYTLGAVTASAQASITPLGITGSFTAADKVYDATTAATIGTRTLTGVLGSDVVTLAGGTATFASKNVGTQTVTGTGFSLAVTDAVNYTLGAVTASAQASITPLGITGSFTAADKVYDGTTAATVLTRSLSGTISGDAVTLSGGTASFGDKQVGLGKTVTGTGFSLAGTDAPNYTLASSTLSATADITARPLTVSAAGVNKVYDGTTAATVTLSDNRVTGDVFTASYASAAFADKHVGTGKPVSVAGIATAGADAGNYTSNTTAATTADITPRALTVSATGVNKTYDGLTNATVTLSDNRVSGDVLNVAYSSAAFGDKKVGTGKAVSVSGVSINGADAGNYTFNVTASTTADIVALGITGQFTAADKVYDGTTGAAINGRSVTGAVSGDAVSLTGGTATFADKHAGTGKTVTGTGFTLAGTDAANYTLASTTLTTTADIASRPLVVSATGVNRVYDGTAAASVTLSDNRVSGDVFTAGYTSATFADKHVGNGKSVAVSGLSIAGADAGNYTANTTAATTADITLRALTVSATGVNKVYDGNTAGNVTLSDNRVSGDVFTASYTTATFADKNVGTAKTVSVTGIAIAGTDAGNYTLNVTASTTGDITALGITGQFTAADKVYDGTTAATVNSRSVTGAVSGDNVSLTGGTATFGNKNAGTARMVTGTGFTLAGTDASNYTLASATLTTTASITVRPLTVTATGVNKVYDGTTAASVTLSDNRVSGDVLTAGSTSAAFADKNVGAGKSVSVSGIAISGTDAGNYTTNTTASTTANITVKTVTGSFTAADKVYDGTTTASITGRSLNGVVSGDAASLVGGTATFDTALVGANKTVTGTGFSLTGADASNYTLASTTLTTTASITSWTARGFYQPVGDTQTYKTLTPSAFVWNTVKGGSTVPLKFNIFKGDVETTSTTDITGFTATTVACVATVEDLVESGFLTTGGTTLRYSGTPGLDGQFIQNWATPKVNGQVCYRVAMTAKDGSLLVAFFKLNK